jgi:hypothetical protein
MACFFQHYVLSSFLNRVNILREKIVHNSIFSPRAMDFDILFKAAFCGKNKIQFLSLVLTLIHLQ